ncbi:hypothetical protein GDO86_018034, partial [Hymenochirus boettgeri]
LQPIVIPSLFLSSSRLSWLNDSGLGFSLEYPTISLHAISKDTAAYPAEHLYVMVNTKLEGLWEKMFSAMCEPGPSSDPEDEDSDNDFEGDEYDVEAHEQGLGDAPTFYTYEEGLSHLTNEGQATLERLENMLANSVSNQHTMAGVRTEESALEQEDGMDVETVAAVPGQFEDADVDH